MDRMLSKIAFFFLVILKVTWASNKLMALAAHAPSPIESLFGSGYICLHITDPKLQSTPAFQALADELAKLYNKTPIVHKIGSNETDVHHPQDPETIHYEVDPTTVRPPISSQIKGRQINLKCTKEGYFSNPNNCTKFFRCVEPMGRGKQWQIVEFDCGIGTIFDEAIRACNHPSSVNPKPECFKSDEDMKGMRGHHRTTPKTDDLDEVYAKPSEEDIETIVDPGNLQKPVDEGNPVVPQQPDEGEQSQLPEEHDPSNVPTSNEPTDEGDLEKGEPDDESGQKGLRGRGPKSPSAPLEEPVEEVCKKPGLMGDPTNCSIYYQCISDHGKFSKITRICTKDKIYDPTEEECRKPKEVKPKPACYVKSKRKAVRKMVNETESTEEVYATPEPETEAPEITEPPTEEPEEGSDETHEDFDEFESSGKTQQIVHHGATHVHKTNVTKFESIEEQPDETIPTDTLTGKKKRIVIPKKTGPKPNPDCTEEGMFRHVYDCSKYIKCIKRGNQPLKTYRFVCNPAGTIFNEAIGECVPPETLTPIPPVPECVSWDDNFREIFEDILSQEEPTPDYEDVPIEDGIGGVVHIRRRKVTEAVVDVVKDPDTTEPTKDITGKKSYLVTKEKGHHRKKPDETDNIDEPGAHVDYDSSTPAPYREETTTQSSKKHPVTPETPDAEPVEALPCPEGCASSCDDEKALIERLTREKGEALALVAEVEKQKSKLESAVKKMQKELTAAKKDKQKYENYIASMDKTIESYKEEVAWYLQHCPQPTEFIEDDEDSPSKSVRTRKRRSLDTSITPVHELETQESYKSIKAQENQRENPYDAEILSKKHKIQRNREENPRPIHTTSEFMEPNTHTRTAPFATYDDVDDKIEDPPHQNHHAKSSNGAQGHHHSHWVPGPDHDGSSTLASEIPLLIFITLSILLVTITLLGCLMIRRINRMTTFSLTPQEIEAYNQKFHSLNGFSDKRRNSAKTDRLAFVNE